jgi:hypothetical membrane protein
MKNGRKFLYILIGLALIGLGIFYFFTNPRGFIVNELISIIFVISGIAVLIYGIVRVKRVWRSFRRESHRR